MVAITSTLLNNLVIFEKIHLMRLIKFKISTDFLKNVQFDSFLSVIKSIEILEIYQYDRSNFFSLQKIIFKPDSVTNLEKVITEFFKPIIYQVLERKGNEVICLMKQRQDQGFWPQLISGFWYIIPPIQLDPDFIVTSVIIKEDEMHNLDYLVKNIKYFEILAINNIENVPEKLVAPNLHFTTRQREIATYAMRNGYYNTPKRISADKIAAKFGISVSAVNEHLRKAEKLAMRYFFS